MERRGLELQPRLARAWVLAVACLAVPEAASVQELPAQEVHRRGFEPADDAVFSVVRQFFDSDSALPLDARTVDEWETEDAKFEKAVFTTSSGERVPGDLALPKLGEPPYPAVLLLHGLGNSRNRWWREDREAAAALSPFSLSAMTSTTDESRRLDTAWEE